MADQGSADFETATEFPARVAADVVEGMSNDNNSEEKDAGTRDAVFEMKAEEERVVVLRFGHDYDPQCMQMDETLYGISEKVKNYAVIYLVDITEVPDFNTMYELYDPCTCMFFFRNKHIMIDLGTGNNNKINWPIHDKQECIDIVETVYRGAHKGRGLVISPKDYSTKYRY